MKISSPAFTDGGPIPRAHTCDGADLSPPLTWSGVPADAKELAVIMDDPDAPGATWVHWVLYGIPVGVTSLAAGVPADPVLKRPIVARQGVTDFRRVGYGGPCPPPGPAHRYVFTLYALSEMLKLPAGATKAVLLEAIKKITLEQTTMIGRYGRVGLSDGRIGG